MGRQRTPQQLAKLVTYILRYRPDEFGLVPNGEGYVRIKDLLQAIGEEEGWRYVRQGHIDEILYTLTDPPIEIDGLYVRARERGTLPGTGPAEPLPKLLYVGIRRKAYTNVSRKGIFPGAHPHIILASDMEMAARIGRRLDASPVLLTVLVQESVTRGVSFRQAGAALYLAESIPVGCFTGPPLPEEKVTEAKQPAKPPATAPTPGTFQLKPDGGRRTKERTKRKKEISRRRDRDRQRKHRERNW